jgi:hypothetical protein
VGGVCRNDLIASQTARQDLGGSPCQRADAVPLSSPRRPALEARGQLDRAVGACNGGIRNTGPRPWCAARPRGHLPSGNFDIRQAGEARPHWLATIPRKDPVSAATAFPNLICLGTTRSGREAPTPCADQQGRGAPDAVARRVAGLRPFASPESSRKRRPLYSALNSPSRPHNVIALSCGRASLAQALRSKGPLPWRSIGQRATTLQDGCPSAPTRSYATPLSAFGRTPFATDGECSRNRPRFFSCA